MISASNFQPKVAPGLRNSLRVSAQFLTYPARHFPRHHSDDSSDDSGLSSGERLSFSEDDLVDIDPEELSAADALPVPPPVHVSCPRSPLSPFEPHIFPLIFRPHISVSRVKELAPHSAQDPLRDYLTQQTSDCTSTTAVDDQHLLPAALAIESALAEDKLAPEHQRFSVQAVSLLDHPSDAFDSSDPFRKGDPRNETTYHPRLVPVSPLRVVYDASADPNFIPPSPPASRRSSVSTIAPSHAISSAGLNPIRKGLRRLRTLTRTRSLIPTRRAASEPAPSRLPPREAASSTPRPHFLPELAFDATPFLDVAAPFEHVSESAPSAADTARHETLPRCLPPAPPTSPDDSRPSFPLIKWERVDPNTLAPSPYAPTVSDISPCETPFVVPSPSWLSRNTFGFDPHLRPVANPSGSPLIEVTPPSPTSPAPLPILPRSLLPVPSSLSAAPSPVTPRIELTGSDHSSVTLYSPTSPSARRPQPKLTIPGSLPPLITRLTPTQLRSSLADTRTSIRSFLTYASLALGERRESPLLASVTDSPSQARFLLLLQPSRDPSPIDSQPSPLPLPLRLTFAASNSSAESKLNNSPAQPFAPEYRVFIPSPRAFEESKDIFPLPNYLRALSRNTSRLSQNIKSMDVYSNGKPADTVDFGDNEVDYSGYEWFKDPPPQAEPAPAPPVTEPYVPQPGVIEQNEMFDYALKHAPNVLYSRYKQYGQLGVLGWCSEFSEMIDAVKHLGFEGNMFVSTRTQALRTCEEILALNLDIEMQIIVMYLSSQVARLRRFLDSEATFDDYPAPRFPTDPHIDYNR